MKHFGLFMALAVGLLFCGTVAGQSEDYVLSLTVDGSSSATVAGGGSETATVGLDSTDGEGMSGFSFGVCHDSDLVSIEADGIANGDDGSDISYFFFSASALDDGWTVGALAAIGQTISAGDRPDLIQATYDFAVVEEETDTSVEFCGGVLGDPATELTIAAGGDEVEPTTENLDLTVAPVSFYAANILVDGSDIGECRYNPDTGEGGGEINPVVSIAGQNGGEEIVTSGFSLGIRHDDTYLTVQESEAAGALADISPIGFYGESLDPDNGPGWTLGVVYSLTGASDITFDDEYEVVTLSYDVDTSSLAGDADGETTTVRFANDLGDPIIANTVVGEAEYGVETSDLTLNFVPQVSVPFVRGDANDDLIVNIADGIWILNTLFQDGPAAPCAEAADANDDGKGDQSDAIFIFNYRFLDGDAPNHPFPDCDVDDDEDEYECDNSSC